MHIDRYERMWIYISAIVLISLFCILLYSTYGLGMHMETNVGQIDPNKLSETPPFDNPGLRQIGPMEYEAVMIAQAWTFTPNEIRVPAGSTVHFTLTSLDVLHGFTVPRSTVNRMVTPGQITKVSHRFTEPGEYRYLCHEYCGTGHHVMSGVIIVEP